MLRYIKEFKNTLITLAVFVSMLARAQKTEILGDFQVLKVSDGLHVNLVKSDLQKVELAGLNQDDVVVKNTNGTLRVSIKTEKIFSSKKPSIIIYFNDQVKEIDANEGSVISSKSKFDQRELELTAKQGAIINIDVDVKYIKSNSISGGIVILSGFALNQDISTSLGGKYQGFKLQSTQAQVRATTGGYAEITVSEILNAKVEIGGKIHYKGKPSVLNTGKVVGGTIKRVN